MPNPASIPLTPQLVAPEAGEFAALSGWAFADPFVSRLLRSDVPRRVRLGNGRLWVYRDPDDVLVGFGTLDVCRDYADLTGGQPHPYIPLLAVNPAVKSRGYGTTIVQHLIAEAALLTCRPDACHAVLFLDVYTSSVKAIEVYTSCGFGQLTDLTPDPQEDGKEYVVMARRVSVAPPG